MYIPYVGGYKGLIDELGIYDSLVLAIADNRLTKNFKDEWAELKRLDDGEEKWFGFDKDGNIPWSEITTWRGSSDVLVKQKNNQGKNALSYPAYQSVSSFMPKIVNAGTNQNGMMFDASNDYMIIDKYSGIDIKTPPFSSYITCPKCNYGHIFSVNGVSFFDNQYMFRLEASGNAVYFYIGEHTRIINAVLTFNQHSIWTWEGYGANQLTVKNSNGEVNGIQDIPLVSKANVRIGCRLGGGAGTPENHFNGTIKNILIFNSNQKSNYNNFVNGGI